MKVTAVRSDFTAHHPSEPGDEHGDSFSKGDIYWSQKSNAVWINQREAPHRRVVWMWGHLLCPEYKSTNLFIHLCVFLFVMKLTTIHNSSWRLQLARDSLLGLSVPWSIWPSLCTLGRITHTFSTHLLAKATNICQLSSVQGQSPSELLRVESLAQGHNGRRDSNSQLSGYEHTRQAP